jgi:hypothetical protein
MNPPDQPTPRTDAAIVLLCDLHGVEIDFARTLERELAETERLRFSADADRRRLRCELAAAQAECEKFKFLHECEASSSVEAHAVREQVSAELTAAKAECDLHRNRLASILWSGTIDKQLCGDVQKWADDYTAELTRLRAEVAAIEEDGTEEHNAAVGLRQKLVAALDRAEKAEAALHALRLVCGTSDADKFTTWLNVEIAKREQAEAELANIANAKPDTWGDMSDSFQAWAQNRARHALAAMNGTPTL